MTLVRFLLDDVTPCKTQHAVLSVFAEDIEQRALGTVVRASQLIGIHQWADVPAESSRRLGLRLLALQPGLEQLTVFLPAHIVPGSLELVTPWGSALAAGKFSTVADLDLFAVSNTSQEVHRFQETVAANPDYETVSRYANFTSAVLPSWMVSGGLTSALQLTQRPWYSAFAPTRLQWLGWVGRAMAQGRLDLYMVEEDIRAGLIRPSLLADVKAVLEGTNTPLIPDLTLDVLFTPPERRLTDQQYRLLHSDELQMRTLKFAKQRSANKLAKLGLLKYLVYVFRRLPLLAFRTACYIYSMTFRPVVRLVRQQVNQRK